MIQNMMSVSHSALEKRIVSVSTKSEIADMFSPQNPSRIPRWMKWSTDPSPTDVSPTNLLRAYWLIIM